MRGMWRDVVCIFECFYATMVQNEQLGLCIKTMYADNEAYAAYASKLSDGMTADKKLIKRNGKIRANLQAQVDESEIVYTAYL